MSDLPERPASIRRPVRPAPDAHVDPIDNTPAATAVVAATQVDDAAPAPRATSVAAAPKKATAARTAKTPPTTPAVAAAPVRASRRELTVPFSTRIRLETAELIDTIAANNGLTQRAVVEEAIKAHWGDNNGATS